MPQRFSTWITIYLVLYDFSEWLENTYHPFKLSCLSAPLSLRGSYIVQCSCFQFAQADALVCSFCYCFVGSIELQIGRRIHAYMQEEADKSGSDRTDCNEKMMRDNIDLPDGLVESLISGNICLPYSNCFPLPSIVSCIGGCKEEIFCRQASSFDTTSWNSDILFI